MPASRVLGHGFIQNITKANKTLPLYYATKTASWERPLDQPAAHVRIGFVNAMKKLSDDKVPSEAVQAVMTETEHPSQKDSYPHYTVVFEDAKKNEVSVEHAYP